MRQQAIEWACEAGFPRNLAEQISDVLQYVAEQSAREQRKRAAVRFVEDGQCDAAELVLRHD